MKKTRNYWSILRYIKILIVTTSLLMTQTIAAHVFTAVNMSKAELILINTHTDDIIVQKLDTLSGWPNVNMLQHTWVTPDHKTIFVSTDATETTEALIIRLGVNGIDWVNGNADLEIVHVFTMDPAGTASQFPEVHEVNPNQPIPKWTHGDMTALHGPTFLPHSDFTYITHLTDNRLRGINMKTNELVDTASFYSKSSQTHGINFNARGTIGLGVGYFFDSNEIDVYRAHNHTGELELVKSIKLGNDEEYAAYTHYTWWLDNRYAVTASMQLDETSLTLPGSKIIGPSVWLIDSLRGKAEKIIGTASSEHDAGVWRSASDLNAAFDKLYVAEEDTISDVYGRDGFVSIFDIQDINNPQFIKRLKPGVELPGDFRVAHSLVTTTDERFVYVTSYASNYIIKIDTQKDEVVKVYSAADGLDVPHGAFVAGRDR